ncbi:hypothetical protein [Microcoleus sp. BROC3]|uniref:hypothetical protein n=1 Tax=Microcoleus sp. BROC3 TaxID=3055323 RepID=UPI002FD1B662
MTLRCKYFTVVVGEYKNIALNLAGNNADKALPTAYMTKNQVLKGGLDFPNLSPAKQVCRFI